jgi:hypothetical protein
MVRGEGAGAARPGLRLLARTRQAGGPTLLAGTLHPLTLHPTLTSHPFLTVTLDILPCWRSCPHEYAHSSTSSPSLALLLCIPLISLFVSSFFHPALLQQPM